MTQDLIGFARARQQTIAVSMEDNHRRDGRRARRRDVRSDDRTAGNPGTRLKTLFRHLPFPRTQTAS